MASMPVDEDKWTIESFESSGVNYRGRVTRREVRARPEGMRRGELDG